ncbi:MAG: Rpn family recombination-promoting nuclease/putative transposase [Bacteroidales bacterium]|nr:Rpn family recombination-promoting nuclease/putative transposase [Bacteroidales bacterium]
MNNKLIYSHDKFFKKIFSKKENIKELLFEILPDEIVKKLNLETIELDSTEYIDEKLRTNFSDLVYNCRYKEQIIKISLLFEHKSSPEQYPHFQLNRYMLNIWQTQLSQKQKLTQVIPIILYHGKKKWQKKSFTEYFKIKDELLNKYIPEFEYLLFDVNIVSNDEITQIFKNIQVRISLLVLKNIFTPEKFLREINTVFKGINEILDTEEGDKFFEQVSAYIILSTNIELPKIIKTMETVSHKAKEKFISTGLKLYNQGVEEGIEKGIEKGVIKVAFSMLKKGFSDKEILDVTGITEKQLNYLKSLDKFDFDIDIDNK